MFYNNRPQRVAHLWWSF